MIFVYTSIISTELEFDAIFYYLITYTNLSEDLQWLLQSRENSRDSKEYSEESLTTAPQ